MLEPSRTPGGPTFRFPPHTLLVAAHPDDETLGAGATLLASEQPWLLHLTDGAPRDVRLWPASFRGKREEYARLRRRELEAALRLMGLAPGRARSFDIEDQQATHSLVQIARRLSSAIDELRPAAVVTHPYEGGHPDHDAAAFAVHAALRLLRGQRRVPPHLEMTSYHRAGGRLATGEFLPGPTAIIDVPLDVCARERKRAMLDCFASQREVLAAFGIERERFRVAPAYDFTLPPHAPPLHYEQLGWPIDFHDWCGCARAALAELELGA